jgi:ribosomal protein L37AE/L43A
MHSTGCPRCGQNNNYRTMSANTIKKCSNCGQNFRLPSPFRSNRGVTTPPE